MADVVAKVASGRGVKPAQVALAWVLGHGEDVVPIPGTKRRKYLEENTAALSVERPGCQPPRPGAVRAARRLLGALRDGPARS